MAYIGQVTRLFPGSPSLSGTGTVGVTPVVINDTWTRLDNPAYTMGDVRAGPITNQGWHRTAVNTTNGDIFLVQGSAGVSNNQGVFFFRPSLGHWERTNSISNDWRRGPVNTGGFTFFENYDSIYDPDRNCFWQSSGGPLPKKPGEDNYVDYVWYGDRRYLVATDEFQNYWPDSSNNYVPVGTDSGYFNVSGSKTAMLGFDSKIEYDNNYIYQFSHYTVSDRQNTKRRDLTTGAVTTLAAYPNTPPVTSQGSRPAGPYRAGMNKKMKYLWQLADNLELYKFDLSAYGVASWVHFPTTNKPSVPAPAGDPSYFGGDKGIQATLDESTNCIIAWCGKNGNVGVDNGSNIRETYVLDLATHTWRDGPSNSNGDTVPPARDLVQNAMSYDPYNERVVMTVASDTYHQVWGFETGRNGGIITSARLPQTSGSTYGVNFYGFPFTRDKGSKHVNMGYCPLNNRIYASGGDSITSATNGIWSMSVEDFSWRLEVGNPVFPTTPAPNGMQDGAILQWSPSRNKFIFGYGFYFHYAGTPVEYAVGTWMFDPVAVAWTQDTTLFNTLFNSGTGCQHGGIYDETTDIVYSFADGVSNDEAGSGVTAVCRWNVTTQTRLSNISFTVINKPPGKSPVFGRGQYTQIGRTIYVAGYFQDGTSTFATSVPAMWKWNIDTNTWLECARPPVFSGAGGSTIVQDEEIKLATSNGKVVWPRINGPEGNMLGYIDVYDPATDTWTTDTKVPNYGNFITNAIASIPACAKFPRGVVAMSGGAFGAQQTHIWFYEAV